MKALYDYHILLSQLWGNPSSKGIFQRKECFQYHLLKKLSSAMGILMLTCKLDYSIAMTQMYFPHSCPRKLKTDLSLIKQTYQTTLWAYLICITCMNTERNFKCLVSCTQQNFCHTVFLTDVILRWVGFSVNTSTASLLSLSRKTKSPVFLSFLSSFVSHKS